MVISNTDNAYDFTSKSSPPASVYDKPGLSFDRLLSSTGCHGNSTPLDCLRDVPFGVSFPIVTVKTKI